MAVSESPALRYQQSDPDVRLMMRVRNDDAAAKHLAEAVPVMERQLSASLEPFDRGDSYALSRALERYGEYVSNAETLRELYRSIDDIRVATTVEERRREREVLEITGPLERRQGEASRDELMDRALDLFKGKRVEASDVNWKLMSPKYVKGARQLFDSFQRGHKEDLPRLAVLAKAASRARRPLPLHLVDKSTRNRLTFLAKLDPKSWGVRVTREAVSRARAEARARENERGGYSW